MRGLFLRGSEARTTAETTDAEKSISAHRFPKHTLWEVEGSWLVWFFSDGRHSGGFIAIAVD